MDDDVDLPGDSLHHQRGLQGVTAGGSSLEPVTDSGGIDTLQFSFGGS
jgi:hypothetical protein